MTPPINSVSDHILDGIASGDLAASPFEVVSIAKELAARRAANTPVGLEWVGDEAKTPFGSYKVERTDDGYAALFGYDEIAHVGFNAVDTPPGARKAAQEHAEADWRGRVSCLTSPAAEPVAWKGKTWLELREPGCVPQRTGPIPATEVAAFLREVFEHRPHAYVTVITIGYDGPSLQDGPECLQMLDGRSMSTGRKHIASSSAAHQGHPAPSASREVTDDLRLAFRNADESDWKHLFAVLPDTGRGRFWKAVLTEARAALLAALPEREG